MIRLVSTSLYGKRWCRPASVPAIVRSTPGVVRVERPSDVARRWAGGLGLWLLTRPTFRPDARDQHPSNTPRPLP